MYRFNMRKLQIAHVLMFNAALKFCDVIAIDRANV